MNKSECIVINKFLFSSMLHLKLMIWIFSRLPRRNKNGCLIIGRYFARTCAPLLSNCLSVLTFVPNLWEGCHHNEIMIMHYCINKSKSIFKCFHSLVCLIKNWNQMWRKAHNSDLHQLEVEKGTLTFFLQHVKPVYHSLATRSTGKKRY